MQYAITSSSPTEVATDVISRMFVRTIVPNNAVKAVTLDYTVAKILDSK